MNKLSKSVSWPILTVGAIVTMVVSLSVHAVMLQGFHVPYPSGFPSSGWARLPDGILSAFGAIYLSAHLPESIRRRSFVLRCGLVFLMLATIRETFFRDPFMEFINLSNFTLYPFLDNVPNLLPLAVIAIGVESWTRRRHRFIANVVAAALLAAIAGLLVQTLADHAFAGVAAFTESREGHQRYGLPYDWHILVPAYLTFLEPVIAALVIGGAVRNNLPRKSLTRFGITAALIVALKGPVVAPFINIHYANTGPLTAFLSFAQFSFETMVLGVLAAATVQLAFRVD